jgi:hypothetical protein
MKLPKGPVKPKHKLAAGQSAKVVAGKGATKYPLKGGKK